MNFHRLILLYALLSANLAFAADEIHWTFTGPNSVAFDWRGTEDAISYRISTAAPPISYTTATAHHPIPLPTSSSGPFWEAEITGLQPNALYYYTIGDGPEHSFITPPLPGTSDFIVYVEGDIGSTKKYPRVADVQNIIGNVYGNGSADFALLVGDLTYADINDATHVDQHFNDVMVWSQDAAYMPVWGNHEWNTEATIPDHLNNYEGRFALPRSFTSPGADNALGNGPDEDWYWFDYGNVRFIAIPEPFVSDTWADWNAKAQPIMEAAQQDSNINFIVTFGHRPAYSSSSPGEAKLQGYLDGLAIFYSKYVLDLSGHHHDYERSDPAQTYGVTHVVVGTGHASPNTFTTEQPSWSVFRTIQPAVLKLHFTGTAIEGELICAPVSTVCSSAGAVLDSFTIGHHIPSAVNITAPASGATVSGVIAVSADASNNSGVAGVQFKLDGVNLGGEDATAPYAISWDTATAQAGGHVLTATARDTAGNTVTSGAVPVTVNNFAADTTPPAVSFTAPASGAAVSGKLTVSVNASDNAGVTAVQFKLDGVNLGSQDATAPYSIAWNTGTVANGAHTLTAVAWDAAGNMGTSGAVQVKVNNPVADTTPPKVSIKTPDSGETVSGKITLSANASDNVGVTGVRFKLDGADLGDQDKTAPYSISWNTGKAANGIHTLTAVARDAAGNKTKSKSISVKVNNPIGSKKHQGKFRHCSAHRHGRGHGHERSRKCRRGRFSDD
jgi:hypothetical protein